MDRIQKCFIGGKIATSTAAAKAAPRRRKPDNGKSIYYLYLREIGRIKLLSRKDECALARRVQEGDKTAREELVKANLRLVVRMARSYEGLGLPLLDLINEGNIGLMKAVEKFDPDRGVRFSSFAVWWIRRGMQRALANQARTVRLPIHALDQLQRINRAVLRFQELLGRDPTSLEIAQEVKLPVHKVKHLRIMAASPTSLDEPMDHDNSSRLSKVIADPKCSTPYEQLENHANIEMIHQIFRDLDPREKLVLRYRFGLDGHNRKTLEEVGQKLGITREYVRQIQNRALKKLRYRIQLLETVRAVA